MGRMTGRAATVVALTIGVLAGACDGGTSPTPEGSPASTFVGSRPQTTRLIAALQARGAAVQVVELMRDESFPFFAVRAVRLTVEGENVYAFEYGSLREAEDGASRISPDGSQIGSAHVDWISDPHFYRSDRLIVLYVGGSARILDLLQQVVGAQIAGR